MERKPAGRVARGFDCPRLMLMLQDFTSVSAVSTDPTFLQWRSSTVEASLVYALDDKWSVQLGLFSTVWTVKTNSQHGAGLAVWRNFESP
jgi:hypothetical protein